jgi:excisionase family DNA binding protein
MPSESTAYAAPRIRLLTVTEVARILAVSRSSVYRLVERGELPRVRVGGSARFRAADIEALIERGLDPGESPDPAGGPGRAKAAAEDGHRGDGC